MKNLISFLVLAGWCQLVDAQVTFQKRISLDSSAFGGTAIQETPDGGFVFGGLIGQIVKLDYLGNPEWAVQFTNSFGVFAITSAPDGSIFYFSTALDSSDKSRQLFVKLNADGEKQWDKLLDISPGNFPNGLAATSNGGILVTSGLFALYNQFRYSKLSSSGELEWAKALDMGAPARAAPILELSGGDCVVGGAYSGESTPLGILLKTTDGGQPLWAKSFSNFRISDVSEFSNGQLLVAGNSPHGDKVVFAKLTAQGDALWIKAVANEGHFVSGIASVTPSDGIILRTGVGGNLMGYLKLDGNGTLEWAKGYPGGYFELGHPQATQDGGFAFLIPSYSVDSASQAGLIKVGADGLLPGCESVDLCVAIENYPTQIENLSWIENDIEYDTAFESLVVPINVIVEDYCAPLEIPAPTFQVPDSICAGRSISPSGLANANVGTWAWTFDGGIPDTSSQQAPSEVFFPQPGTFEIKQVISFGGCLDSFSTVLTVRPAPELDFGPDTLLCEADAYLLDGTSPTAISYLWENGSAFPQRSVENNGIYKLLVSNGFCETEDSVEVRFFAETYPGALLDLGADSTLCDNFSLVLDATTPEADNYLWEDGSTTPLRTTEQSGSYSVMAFFENCPLSDEVEITFINCEGRLFVPNAFSPNGDGVNDQFLLFGKDVLLKNLKIFDRWGGLLHDSELPDMGWDGQVKGKPAMPGVYVYLIEYEELISGKTFVASGEVHLIR